MIMTKGVKMSTVKETKKLWHIHVAGSFDQYVCFHLRQDKMPTDKRVAEWLHDEGIEFDDDYSIDVSEVTI